MNTNNSSTAESHLVWLFNNALDSLHRANEALAEINRVPTRQLDIGTLTKIIHEDGISLKKEDKRYETTRLFIETVERP